MNACSVLQSGNDECVEFDVGEHVEFDRENDDLCRLRDTVNRTGKNNPHHIEGLIDLFRKTVGRHSSSQSSSFSDCLKFGL